MSAPSGGDLDAVVSIREATDDDFAALEPLWRALYDHQSEHGMLLRPSADAFEQWEASLRPTLGRFSCLFVACEGAQTIGFLAGRIRSIPKYWGGGQAGYISDVFVTDAMRGRGVGTLLLDAAKEWFRRQGVGRLELHVVRDNDGAMRFYAREGWVEELVQMVYELSPND